MSLAAPLSQINSPEEIYRHLAWHHQQDLPLVLMCGAGEGQWLASIVEFVDGNAALQVVCKDLLPFSPDTPISYAVIGTTPNGANFLASGQMVSLAGVTDGFKLSFPTCLDVSQARDDDRRSVSAGHSLHFCALDPHLNDMVCRVQNISMGGLAVFWEHSDDHPPPVPNGLTDVAILQSSDHRVHLGRLRAVHVTACEGGYTIGLKFEQGAPDAYGSLVHNTPTSPAQA